MNSILQVLLVEDEESDATLIVRELSRAGFEPKWQRVETEEAYLSTLRADLDDILSDYRLP